MTSRTRQGLGFLSAALAFGVCADVLGRTVPARLDVALGLGALLLLAGLLVQRGVVAPPTGLAPLGLPLAFLGVSLIWRDSPTLFGLNLLGIAVLAALATPWVRAVVWSRAGVTDYATGAGQLAGSAAWGSIPLVLSDIDWHSLPHRGLARRVRGTAVGLLAAAPVALVFGGLLMDADPVFNRLMTDNLAVRLEFLTSHTAAVITWAWVTAGVLRLLLSGGEPKPQPTRVGGGRYGLAEVGTVLVIVDLLFLAFVLVQLRYLFGGHELVRALTGLSYAEYARSGFFQLVWVAALSLPFLLLADWLLERRDPVTRRRFRWLAALMLLLLNIMLASALFRMRLYTLEYGLTELRFYTTAFMGWLVLVFGWFAATVLRGRRRRFGAGALTAGFLVLAVLNLVNPDNLIARTNLARAVEGRSFDVEYAARLSADAVPTLLAGVSKLPPCDASASALATALEARWRPELVREAGTEGDRWNIALAKLRRLGVF
jgi:Domain of unknown function (DUF4173)